jgi:hypothetical protein
MMEERQHNNLWAEKLSQVSLPDGGGAWLAMEAILDKEMPTGWRRDRRRWLLLILLLLLLIGVCNCPGRGRFSAVTARWRWPKAFQTVPVGDKIAHGPSPVAGNTPRVAGNPSNAVRDATPAGATSPAIPGAAIHPRYTLRAPVKHHRLHSGPKGTTTRDPTTNGTTAKRSPKAGSPGAVAPDAGSPESALPGAGSPAKRASVPAAGPPDSSARAAMPKKKDSLATPVRKPVVKDSTHKKPPAPPTPPKEKPETKRDGGFMVGIGLNQFFTVGGQQASSWNSGGITGTLSDYIPVPMVRYYVNSRLYVQLEAQINTPQYTKKNLVINEIPADSGSPARFVESSVSINKLFYFNLPLSVHYTIAKNLDLGMGLQYSQLTNGIGVFSSGYNTNFNTTNITGITTIDSISSQTKSFKGDSLYRELKTHEFRWLLDVNYTYHHFILGLRYNQALSKFINVQVSSTQVTQARNSSLQLYLRYILWDGRKKKPLLPAK